MTRALILITALLLSTAAEAYFRSAGEVYRFRKEQPCPVNGKVKGACPGWQVDHVVALRCGGIDHKSNMQWLTIKAHRVKTKLEARRCRNQPRR